jgi:hypothetical protein
VIILIGAMMLYFKKISKLIFYFILISFFVQNNNFYSISNIKNNYSNSIQLDTILNTNNNIDPNILNSLAECNIGNCPLNDLFKYFRNKYKEKYNPKIELEIQRLRISNHVKQILKSGKQFVFVSDIDGTILKEGDNFFNESYRPFLQTLKDLSSLGIKIVLITGGGCDEKKSTVIDPIIKFFDGNVSLLNNIRIYCDGAARYINLDKIDINKKEINGNAKNLPNKTSFSDQDIEKIKQLLITESETKFGINPDDIELWDKYYKCTDIQNGIRGGLTIPWARPDSPKKYNNKSPLVHRKRNDENGQPIPCILNKEYFQLSIRCLPPCTIEGFYDGFVKKQFLEGFNNDEIKRLTTSARQVRYNLFKKIQELFPKQIIFWQSTYVIHICVANKQEALEHALNDKSFIGDISRDKIDTIYFGNEFYEGGNDRPVIEKGICAVNIGPLRVENPLENLVLFNSNIEYCHTLISDIKDIIIKYHKHKRDFVKQVKRILNLPINTPKKITDALFNYALHFCDYNNISFSHPALSKEMLTSV